LVEIRVIGVEISRTWIFTWWKY